MKVACCQMNSSDNLQQNTETILQFTHEAAEQQVDLICFPENCSIMAEHKETLFMHSLEEKSHPLLKEISLIAFDRQINVALGSVPVFLPHANKLANRSYIFDKTGSISARYDKLHLFDATVAKGESYKESNRYVAGNKAVIAKLESTSVGMSICYDLRFPNLYRHLASNGAKILLIPAAFTVPTGKAHWEVLLRARAIETSSYVIASAQYGTHAGNRQTYGHSMIINPWGEIIKEAKESRQMLLIADLDLAKVDQLRQSIANLFCTTNHW